MSQKLTSDHVLLLDNLVDDCKLRGGVYFIDSIPISASGKPILREIKELATKLYKTNVEHSVR